MNDDFYKKHVFYKMLKSKIISETGDFISSRHSLIGGPVVKTDSSSDDTCCTPHRHIAYRETKKNMNLEQLL